MLSPSLIVDAIIVIILAFALWGGWRQGAFTSLLSTVGVVAGLVVGAALAPFVMGLTDSTALRFLLAIGTVMLLVGVGNLLGAHLGAAIRNGIKFKASRVLDSTIGSLFQVAATLIVVWLVAIPLATGLPGTVASGIRDSRILSFVDRYTPHSLDTLPSKIAAMLSESGLPPLISPFTGGSNVEVEAPEINVENVALVEAMRPSVIHVMGDAQECSRRLMGSGFVAAPDYVITNAHVVAGTSNVNLDTMIGTRSAEVVFYDPDVDIAVLYSPGLGLDPLQWADTALETGDEAIVMGFPQSGPFNASPARVRERIMITGSNIYANGQHEREAYSVRSSIQSGNSGGPMTNEAGEVAGVVFGAAIDGSDTGYVLTADEVRARIGDITMLTQPVDTMQCAVS
ncbi:trypsin-like serine protease [Corynebacterium deserti GIMN1.010]|uniref:Trypsin-like serine protease n=1 Tax=Corynebacterium deserti GIMN1.010 TaxID=931089 RepID=A0A0M4CVR2_9CORY|nr:MarP family serine protease [Corynebacterium deserti]ALC04782.1 trypsin-like serine protease [Corynebacterium deserti GIMN1.010]